MTFRGPLTSPIQRPTRSLEQHQQGNLLETTLAAPAAPKPFAQTDWPLPVRRKGVAEATPQSNLLETLLLSKDAMVVGKQVYDLPVPRRQPLPVDLLGASMRLLVAPPPPSPFFQTDWPLSVPRVRAADYLPESNLLETTLVGKDALPHRKSDWPNPILRVRPADYLPESNLLETTLVGKDALVVGARVQDLPPRPPKQPTHEFWQPLALNLPVFVPPTPVTIMKMAFTEANRYELFSLHMRTATFTLLR
jgi:hypothetical protein